MEEERTKSDKLEAMLADTPASQTHVNRELLLDFFLTFSRFEYALKSSNYFTGSSQEAKPDWLRFANSLQGIFQADRNEQLQQAYEYIVDYPPQRQVIVGDSIDWQVSNKHPGESDIQFLLRMVRYIRNNLFHGGKHNIGVDEDTQRTELLLRNSLTILKECLVLAPHVKAAFDQAII